MRSRSSTAHRRAQLRHPAPHLMSSLRRSPRSDPTGDRPPAAGQDGPEEQQGEPGRPIGGRGPKRVSRTTGTGWVSDAKMSSGAGSGQGVRQCGNRHRPGRAGLRLLDACQAAWGAWRSSDATREPASGRSVGRVGGGARDGVTRPRRTRLPTCGSRRRRRPGRRAPSGGAGRPSR